MSVEPPSSGRPTGPPSGPLSGPSGSPGPPGPSSESPGGPGGPGGSSTGGTGGGGRGSGRPWWGSVPRVAAVAAAVVVAVVLAVVLTRPGGSSGGSSTTASDGEVFLQPAGRTGPDPFTASTARDGSGSAAPVTSPPADDPGPGNVTRGVDGSAPGLYGGTRKTAACDVEKQITALGRAPGENRAFASVLGLRPSEVPAYLRALTPVQLRMDTRVTNHGYRDGKPTAYQAVLQAGTAVLVDDRGVPRVRCACGNPLLPPVALKTAPKNTGEAWSAYRASDVVVVSPAAQAVEVFVVFDPDSGDWFTRHKGDTGGKDRKTGPPADRPSPSVSSAPPSSDSPSPCGSAPDGPASPCPPASSPDTSAPPSSPSAETGSPSADSSAPADSSGSADSSGPASGDGSATTTESAASPALPGPAVPGPAG
ncbi:DUF6777 domain-containing protein [Streptomyces apricus]|uniref:DUF6777 domain-containing protein n=1 Tax=Streptomyces apricus TaxID=1828112 RepID=A0A5B0AKG9_9ACTN|nr:DUF6777 domain-containing protein [Streptomyces apricus]KAA0929676.1 hypothetical protein FGF04_30815 [Streptomyces apricus]